MYEDQDGVEIVENGELGSLDERAQAVTEATTFITEDIRPMLPFARNLAYAEDMKVRYAAGKKFRVIREGARLEGIRQFGKVRAGYAEELEVGDIITSTGFREGMAGGGFMESNFKTDSSPDNCLWLQFWPMMGLWMPWPLEGWIEPADELKGLGA